jgi:hypothetical protein
LERVETNIRNISRQQGGEIFGHKGRGHVGAVELVWGAIFVDDGGGGGEGQRQKKRCALQPEN